MIKITFLLKEPNTDHDSLEYITIDNPKKAKVENDTWESRYVCEVYLSDIKAHHPPIYGANPIDTLGLAVELVKIRLQALIYAGYIVSEVENKEPWKLEKGKTFSEHISEIKNNKDISTEDKEKILGIMKEMANSHTHQLVKDQLNKAIDES